jgi:hypothetical protein
MCYSVGEITELPEVAPQEWSERQHEGSKHVVSVLVNLDPADYIGTCFRAAQNIGKIKNWNPELGRG